MNENYFILVIILAVSILVACDNDDNSGDAPSRFYGEIDVDGRSRTFLVDVPGERAPVEGMPLVIMLHGTGGSAAQAERDYGWTEKGQRETFIVVYPEGVQGEGRLKIRTWNAGRCCQYAMERNVDDTKFISSLLDHLVSRFPVDESRIYVAGMSNGAMLAYRIACEIPGRFAAIGAVSGTMMVSDPCVPSRAIPVVHIHSDDDTKVPYPGGKGIGGYCFSPVDSAIQVMKVNNGCSTVTTTEYPDYRLSVIKACAEDASIETYLLGDGGHSWAGGRRSSARSDIPSTTINATDVIWDFFRRHKRER